MKGRPYLVQEEVWFFNFSQGVLKEAEHELLHLKPVNSPQLLVGVGWGGAHERPPVMSPAPLSQAPWPSPTQPYPLVLEEKLLELRKGHTTELRPLPCPVGKKGSTWQPGGWYSPQTTRGPLEGRAQLPASTVAQKGPAWLTPSHGLPTCTRSHQGRTPPPHFKPNLRALASKKGRSICRRQKLVRARAPGRPHGKRAFRKKGWGNREGQASRGEKLEKWHPKALEQGSGAEASRAGAGVGEQGQGPWEGRRLRHRLLGAVHEAAIQLSKLPVGDVTAALLQVLHGTGRGSLGPRPAAPGLRPLPAGGPGHAYRQTLSEEAHVGDPVVDLGQHVLQVLG